MESPSCVAQLSAARSPPGEAPALPPGSVLLALRTSLVCGAGDATVAYAECAPESPGRFRMLEAVGDRWRNPQHVQVVRIQEWRVEAIK